MNEPVRLRDLFKDVEPTSPSLPQASVGKFDPESVKRVIERMMNSAYDGVFSTHGDPYGLRGDPYDVHPDEYRERVECVRQASAWRPILLPGISLIDRPMVRPVVYDMCSGFLMNPGDARVVAEMLPDHVAWARFVPFPGRS